MKKITLLLSLIAVCIQSGAKDYSASTFGIKSNGTTLNTTSIQKAIDHISLEGGGRLIFSVGRYLTGTIELKDNVTIVLGEGAILVGSTNPYDYRKTGDAFGLVVSNGASNIGIVGRGVIDGQGRELANNFLVQITNGIIKDRLSSGRPADRPHLVYLLKSRNALVKGINLRNSSFWTFSVDKCDSLHIDGVTVDSRAFWNNDGIDIIDCTNSVIENCFVNAADDGICLKSHHNDVANENLLIRNNTVTSSASGFKFGTVSRGGFKNIRIINNTVYDTFRSAIAIEAVDGAAIENILVDSLKSLNNLNVIFMVTGSRNTNNGRPGSIKGVTIRNLYAEVAGTKPDYGKPIEGPTPSAYSSPRPCIITGSSNQIIEDITLENITVVTPASDPELAVRRSLEDLDKIREPGKMYPEYSQFGESPAWGFFIRHVNGISFKNVTLECKGKDYRPAVVLDDVANGDFRKLKARAVGMNGRIYVADNCSNIKK